MIGQYLPYTNEKCYSAYFSRNFGTKQDLNKVLLTESFYKSSSVIFPHV